MNEDKEAKKLYEAVCLFLAKSLSLHSPSGWASPHCEDLAKAASKFKKNTGV